MMNRVENWSEVLADFIANGDRPFCWGEWDCGLFAANCVLAMTGIDIAAEFRGRYKTARGAYRVMRGDIESVMVNRVAPKHNLAEIAPAMAKRGDLCVLDTPLGYALGVCVGTKVVCTGPDGLAYLPISSALRAWSI
jgi:hypothetical protein